MSKLKIQIVEHFYSESLKYKVYSEDFLTNTKPLSKLYRDNFGMNQTWLDYHKTVTECVEKDTLKLLSRMKDELIKFYDLA